MSKNRRKRKLKNLENKKKEIKNQETIFGTIDVAMGGFGFFKPQTTDNNKNQDLFVPAKYMNGVISGDKVEVVLIKDRFRGKSDDTRNKVGKVVKIVKRERTTVVGELLSGHKVCPLDKKLFNNISLSGSLCGAKRGDWVEVSLNTNQEDLENNKRHRDKGAILEGSLTSVVGKVGTVNGDLDAIVKEYNLPTPYTEEQNTQAMNITPVDIHREDLTNLMSLTIDPFDAKDFDDAISIMPTNKPNIMELGVHIADVAAWIRPHSQFDEMAKDRAFTAYLPGRTLPMLPKTLTKTMSLTAGEPVPAHSLLMEVNTNTGKIISVKKRCHSNILVKQRLNYEEVQEHINGNTPEKWNSELRKNIQLLVDITHKMREYRKKKEHFLELVTTDIRVVFDNKENTITGIKIKTQSESEQVVEECMLAANSAVANELIEQKIPGLYRTHSEPEELKLEEFSAFMNQNFGISPGDLSSRVACNHFLNNLPDDRRRPVIINNFLRALPRAIYLDKNDIHFGLGKGRYSHFTSPIRRYSDLVVHQQLWAIEFKDKTRSISTIAKFAEDITKKEMNNDSAYFAANDRMKLHYLQKQLLEHELDEIDSIITKISNKGITIELPEIGLYGFILNESFRDNFQNISGKLISKKHHKEYLCGDVIKVQLERIDFIKGSAIFVPIND